MFLKHAVPCKIMWDDLVNFDDGVVFETYLEGFGITVSTSGGNLMLNDQASVNFPDMYHNDWLVIHGSNRYLWNQRVNIVSWMMVMNSKAAKILNAFFVVMRFLVLQFSTLFLCDIDIAQDTLFQ
jgi:hypothetical protein